MLVRREVNVGHGARSVSRTIELRVDTLSWHASLLGLQLEEEGVGPALASDRGDGAVSR